ncbi:MAG: VCBS repeat-containing protein [Kofleriaceae bacterium]|nr:VCBS repeat-containing protein [Myxococcales bacterium]MCB9561507.1 VCBS repeat-containing protein [Kofleriaceae bacterium]
MSRRDRRLPRFVTSAALAATGLLGACSWSAFDDLADGTWVDSAGAADGIEPNELGMIASPGMTNRNAVFVVVGRSTDSVGGYSYDADGARAAVGSEVRGGATQFGPLPDGVPIAGDPYSNVIGIAAITGASNEGDTKVVSFKADDLSQIEAQNDFNDVSGNSGPLDGPIQPTGMVYARTDDDGGATTDIILARGAQIAMVQDYDNDAHTLVACYGETDSDVVKSVARGPFDPNDTDDELVAVVNDNAGTAPTLVVFDGRAIAMAFASQTGSLTSCFLDGDADRTPLARLPGPAGEPDFGAAIVVGDFNGDGLPDIVVSSPEANVVRAYINDGDLSDGTTEVMVGAPLDASRFGASLAAGDLDGDGADELVIGAPRSNPDGVNNAGAAYIYSLSGGTFTIEATLHDAQPEDEQQLGKAVAVVPWTAGGRSIVVVGGATEIFTYFRTLFYDDVRNGQ